MVYRFMGELSFPHSLKLIVNRNLKRNMLIEGGRGTMEEFSLEHVVSFIVSECKRLSLYTALNVPGFRLTPHEATCAMPRAIWRANIVRSFARGCIKLEVVDIVDTVMPESRDTILLGRHFRK